MGFHEEAYSWDDDYCDLQKMYICETTNRTECAVRQQNIQCKRICKHRTGSLICDCGGDGRIPDIKCAEIMNCIEEGTVDSSCDRVCVTEAGNDRCYCDSGSQDEGCIVYSSKCGFNEILDLNHLDIGLIIFKTSGTRHCEWDVNVQKGKVLDIIVQYNNIVGDCDQPRCAVDYLEIYDTKHDTHDKLAIVCGDITEPPEMFCSARTRLDILILTTVIS
ncbi:uncharacterized protein [Ptychodera flava]|uniref:uncharacterized protein n=1 Tax=Ptychodera flava TaxID=63121 RepID=UPI00396A4525